MTDKKQFQQICNTIVTYTGWPDSTLAAYVGVHKDTVLMWRGAHASPNKFNQAVLLGLDALVGLADKEKQLTGLAKAYQLDKAEGVHEYIREHCSVEIRQQIRCQKRGKKVSEYKDTIAKQHETIKRLTGVVEVHETQLALGKKAFIEVDEKLNRKNVFISEMRNAMQVLDAPLALLPQIAASRHSQVMDLDARLKTANEHLEHGATAYTALENHLITVTEQFEDRIDQQRQTILDLKLLLTEAEDGERVSMDALASLGRAVAHYHDRGSDQ